jgi:hypothetical protein
MPNKCGKNTTRAVVQREYKRNHTRKRNVIVYSSDGRAAYAVLTTKATNKGELCGQRRIAAYRLFQEEGSYVVETNETRGEAKVRLEKAGYTLFGKFPTSDVKEVDEGACIYTIETKTECYIGWTCRSVNHRLTTHARDTRCRSRRLMDEGGTPRIIERYCPGTWTKRGMEQREMQIINQSPNCVNYLGNEKKLIYD